MMASLQKRTQLLMYVKHKTTMCMSLVFVSATLIGALSHLESYWPLGNAC